MHKRWRIEYYESSTGTKHVEDFISSLPEKAQVKIVRTLELLEEFGILLNAPHTKKLIGTPLWELRILGSDNLRVFYFAREKQQFVLLHGFRKKTQKIEKKEIKLAMQRYKDYLCRKK